MLYCFYFSDTEAFEACFRLLHDDDDDDDSPYTQPEKTLLATPLSQKIAGKPYHIISRNDAFNESLAKTYCNYYRT